MKFERLTLAIYTWFSETSGIATIWAEQSGPKPKRPYATLKLITGAVKVGGEDNLRQYTSGKFVLNGPRTVTVRCQVFGEGALDILSTVRDSLDDPSIIDGLDLSGLSVQDDGEPSNVTERLETSYEIRAVMDVKFDFNEERVANVGYVSETTVNGRNIVS